MPTAADPSDPLTATEAPVRSHGLVKRLIDWDTRVSQVVAVDWPHPRWVRQPLGAFSLTANYGILWFALAGLAALVSAEHRAARFAFVAGAVLGAEVLTYLVKIVFNRRRPPERDPDSPQHIPLPLSPSFPSSHGSMGAIGAFTMSLLYPHWGPAFVAITLALAFSRVYLRVHYLLDVVAGLVLGSALGLALVVAVGAR